MTMYLYKLRNALPFLQLAELEQTEKMLPNAWIFVALLFLLSFSFSTCEDTFEEAFRRLLEADRKDISGDYNASMR